MDHDKKSVKELFSYLDIPRVADREQVVDTVAMSIEFLKYQGEVAYEIGKKQAIAITSTASTLGVGWSAFFFGIALESWLTTSIGLMLVFGATYLLGFWTPRILDKARKSYEEIGAARFYKKWHSESSAPGAAGQRQ